MPEFEPGEEFRRFAVNYSKEIDEFLKKMGFSERTSYRPLIQVLDSKRRFGKNNIFIKYTIGLDGQAVYFFYKIHRDIYIKSEYYENPLNESEFTKNLENWKIESVKRIKEKVVEEYTLNSLEPELRPEFVEKVNKIMEKEPIKVDNLRKRYE
ncbi:DUF2683 family protein [Methanococcus maripaludis]|uniref:Uncharacterized protein n=2 Tax=Methanococcus maripaludis TaxID=39152 RepID=A0A7J9PJB5_METMI|nr:DUF2683 family protein [Methanococcus maripaludis]MBA2861619.1 hypothetical protein [Methanococcus maripaludis]